jgi:hypothetical protein
MNFLPGYQLVRVTPQGFVAVVGQGQHTINGKGSSDRFAALLQAIEASGYPTEFLTCKEVGSGKVVALDASGTRYYFR